MVSKRKGSGEKGGGRKRVRIAGDPAGEINNDGNAGNSQMVSAGVETLVNAVSIDLRMNQLMLI